MSETQRPSDVMPVLDDFLGTMAEDGIFTERSFPQQQVNALDVTGGPISSVRDHGTDQCGAHH